MKSMQKKKVLVFLAKGFETMETKVMVDTIWVLIAAMLVFFMKSK